MKVYTMSGLQRHSISLNNENSEALRALVDAGTYPSISSAVDAAVGNLVELERERKAWWDEVVRRCDEAEAHPERLLDFETFRQGLEQRIDAYKAKHGR